MRLRKAIDLSGKRKMDEVSETVEITVEITVDALRVKLPA
jgi:hypothetical protein